MRVVGAVVAVVLLLLGGVVFAGGNYIYGQNLPVETDKPAGEKQEDHLRKELVSKNERARAE